MTTTRAEHTAALPGAAAAAAPAGYWRRHVAWTLDAALLALPTWLLVRGNVIAAVADLQAAVAAMAQAMAAAAATVLEGAMPADAAHAMLADPAAMAAIGQLQLALLKLVGLPALVFALLALAWHAGFEQTRWQASPGKRALGLRVTDETGGKPGLARSVGRHLAGALSWITLNLGHAMAALPPRHVALHDLPSGTRVVIHGDRRWPAWASLWLALQALALLAALAWWFVAMRAAMDAALGL